MRRFLVFILLPLILGLFPAVLAPSVGRPIADIFDELNGKWSIMSFVGGPPGFTASWGETTIARSGRTFSFQAQITIGQQAYNFEVSIRSQDGKPLLSVKHDFPGPSIENFGLNPVGDGGFSGKGTVQWQNRETPVEVTIGKNEKGQWEFSFAFNGATAKTDLDKLREQPLYTFTFMKKA
jgi:hypothetical protein